MQKTKETLVPEIIDLVVESLNLHFVSKAEVNADTLLMGEGLGLDSVDILEVVVAIEQHYGVKVQNAEQGKKIFHSIGTICDFILATSPSLGVKATSSELASEPSV